MRKAAKALNIAETNLLLEEKARCSSLFSVSNIFFLIKVDCTMNIMQECLKFSQTENVHTYIQLFQSMRCTFASAKEKQQK